MTQHRSYLLYIVVAVINVVFAAVVITTGSSQALIYENGVLETMQELLAAAALGVFLFAALWGPFSPIKTAGVALSSILAIAIFREIDFRTLHVDDRVALLTDASFRDPIVLTSVALVLGYLFVRREHFYAWVPLLFNRNALPLWLAGGLLVASILQDGGDVVGGIDGEFFEEMLELNGYVFLLVAAWRHAWLVVSTSVLLANEQS